MGKTILELFKGSPQDTSVKADTETLVEQETSGIRTSSAVEINNPLIYGNEAGRITLRSTPLLEDMKGGISGENDGGLIGGKISAARDFINSTIGIPETQTPSRLIDNTNIQISNIENISAANKAFPGVGSSLPSKAPKSFEEIPSNIPITKDIISKNGTGLGALLKSTGGGNPKTIGKQALGKGIGLAKDKLRGALFGEQTVGSNDIEPQVAITNNQRTYTDINKSKRAKSEEGVQKDLEGTKLDLSKVSPIYGLSRGGDFSGRFGTTENAYTFNQDNPRKNERLPNYNPNKPFGKKIPLEDVYGIGKGGSQKNLDRVLPSNEYTLDEDKAFIKVGEDVYTDFVPVWFRKKGTEKPIAFRAILSGITENTSPSWSSNKFIGNPYSFYMYDGVERSVSFNIKIFATSPSVLSSMWERLKLLTAYTYPTIANGLTTPPIIDFRLGSIYVEKTGFIETLTYTIPDESNWETNGELGYLPKTIDVSITVKFIEQQGSEDRLYDFTISQAAVDAINEKRETTGVSGDPQTGNETNPPKMTKKGESKVEVVKKGIKSLNPFAPSTTSLPSGLTPTEINPVESQSGVTDKLKGKTPIENTKQLEQKSNVSNQQASQLEHLALTGPEPQTIPRSGLPKFANERVIGTNGAIFVKQSGYSPYTRTTIDTYYEIDINGSVTLLGEKDDELDAALGL